MSRTTEAFSFVLYSSFMVDENQRSEIILLHNAKGVHLAYLVKKYFLGA